MGRSIDQETAELSGEISLINLSQDAKNQASDFGKGNFIIKTKEVPTQAIQIHEKSFYICPAARNPRLLLVGRIRIEVRKGTTDDKTYESYPPLSKDQMK